MKPALFFFLSLLLLFSCNHRVEKDPLKKNISADVALADFAIFRNILESAHPSLTLYQGKEIVNRLFDSVYADLKNSSRPLRDLYNSLFFITNELGCSHTDVFLPDHIFDTLENRKFFFPYPVLWVENKLLVNTAGYDLPEGTQVLSINNMPVNDLLAGLAVYNSIEGFHRPGQMSLAAKDFSFQYYLKWGEQKRFILQIIDTLGKKRYVTEDPITYGEWSYRNDHGKYYYDAVEVDYDLVINEKKNYAYIRLPTFDFPGNAKIRGFEHFCANSFELLDKKKNITRLIIDIRENHGGRFYAAFLLFSYLANKPYRGYDYVFSKIKQIPYPEYLDPDFVENEKSDINYNLGVGFGRKTNGNYYYIDSLIENWDPDAHRFKGQVFVITNPVTASSASYFAAMVKYSGVGKIVGDETAGGAHSGNGFQGLTYVLPETGIKLGFSYAHIIYSIKGAKNNGRGVLPDYTVPDTYRSFRDNNDIQFDYILDSLKLN